MNETAREGSPLFSNAESFNNRKYSYGYRSCERRSFKLIAYWTLIWAHKGNQEIKKIGERSVEDRGNMSE